MSDAPPSLDAALPRWAAPALVATLVAGIAFRLHSGSALWLDEALTVNIASVPLADLPDRLRHDGSPPLYYALLHLWMRVFGDSDLAVRSMSTVFALATLPVAYVAGLRMARGDRRTAFYGLALLAASPFAIRFATEARMYALIMLLTTVGIIVVDRALERPTVARLLPLAAISAALVMTHYWTSFVLVATAGVVLLFRRARRVAAATLAGAAAAVLPWLPVLLYQVKHTGTPWAAAPGLHVALAAVTDYAGGYSQTGAFLSLLMLGLAVVALFGRPAGPKAVTLRLPGERRPTALAALSLGGLAVGVVASVLLRSGFAARYAAIALVPFLLLVAFGIRKLPSPKTQAVVAAVCVVLGFLGAIPLVHNPRSQARLVAGAITERAAPGDLVVYCPDQLGPAVSRHLPDDMTQLVYPTKGTPKFVDWVDYRERNRAAVPEAFAADVLRQAGDNTVWLVWANGYRTFSEDCQTLRDTLLVARGETRSVKRMGRYFEKMMLYRFPGS
ncbi:MAG TPA: glycosyltransferase family 39 protein [Acidimicrobiales bacterium]|nr:glycosyltransferase family 39 protein [Acidimicrobiales bacterium]